MSNTGKIVLAIVAVGTIGVIAWLLTSNKQRPPVTAAISGPASGQAPVNTRTDNKVVNTVNDLLGFTKQAVDIFGAWNKSKSMSA